MKPNEQAQIDFIVGCLRSGQKRKDALSKFVQQWPKLSTKTFDRRLKVAEDTLGKEMDAVKEQANERVSQEADALGLKMLTVQQRIDILARMALGELEVEQVAFTKDGEVRYRAPANHNERKAAIAELNKMCGDYAPTKTDVQLTQTPQVIFPGE